MQKTLIFFLLFIPTVSFSYPQFIGYKYTSCLTCHFNSQGSGQINDYGRALWATEIAGRAFTNKMSPEKLGEMSGFLFKKELPWWLRLGAKFRQIWIKSNPFRSDSSSNDILMQADMNVALLSKSQKYAFIFTGGYADDTLQTINSFIGKPDSAFISREHYLRYMATDSMWLYLGKMDKVFGIRHANHSAFSRKNLGISQSDQVHGFMGHYIKNNWEGSLHLFAGDLQQETNFRESGASAMFEYDLKESWRVGVSMLTSKTDSLKRNLLGFQSKVGLGHGQSFLFDGGFTQTTITGEDSKLGYYIYSEAMQKIKRGYHLFITGQAYKDDMTGSSLDQNKFGLGLLMFPLQRVEWRIEAENGYFINPGFQDAKSSWAVYAQLHLSL